MTCVSIIVASVVKHDLSHYLFLASLLVAIDLCGLRLIHHYTYAAIPTKFSDISVPFDIHDVRSDDTELAGIWRSSMT